MAFDILSEIVEKRKADIACLGVSLGFEVPEKRVRKIHQFVPFGEKGVILEIKRASPSKGDIAPSLSAPDTAKKYAHAGAMAISCLTEQNYFKGNLSDFMAAACALDDFERSGEKIPALLRKDFLLSADEVEVSFRAGADAVLLIARILSADVLVEMAKKCAELGLTSLIEVRKEEDLEKLEEVAREVPAEAIVCGVNARDLRDFSIDLLTPVRVLEKIRKILGENARVVFESGIRTPLAARFSGSLGFNALLLGEAAARNPSSAASLVTSFSTSPKTQNATSWTKVCDKLNAKKEGRPLVKICGITNEEDALKVAELGADALGFVFAKKSPRCVVPFKVNDIVVALERAGLRDKVLLVGVVTDVKSEEALFAKSLLDAGALDFIQLHGCQDSLYDGSFSADEAHFCAVNLCEESDFDLIETLKNNGEPRFLVDAKSGDKIGGTGERIPSSLLAQASKKNRLWLAGGISADNVCEIVKEFNPELIDVSSCLEEKPGKKSFEKLERFFSEINKL